jgi:hypothetical protein
MQEEREEERGKSEGQERKDMRETREEERVKSREVRKGKICRRKGKKKGEKVDS